MVAVCALAAISTRSASAEADEAKAEAPAPASAPESAAPAAQGDKSIEVVVTGTRTVESSRRAPVRTEVVTREEAERRGAADIGEALQGQLGVQVNPSAY
ncbi:MAG TPA: TonB-dependent receptor, partial [Polyangiaceae bacterium]|nr:TonB-dependent receptor [Polyangiaceae bacterium]